MGTSYTTNQTGTRFPDGCTRSSIELDSYTGSRYHYRQTICSGASFPWNGMSYTTNGLRFPGADDCTADQALDHSYTKPADIITDKTICSGASFLWNGTSYTTNQTGTRF
jgi:hypothetical protein